MIFGYMLWTIPRYILTKIDRAPHGLLNAELVKLIGSQAFVHSDINFAGSARTFLSDRQLDSATPEVSMLVMNLKFATFNCESKWGEKRICMYAKKGSILCLLSVDFAGQPFMPGLLPNPASSTWTFNV